MMADVSNVRYEEMKDIYESLEALSCKSNAATRRRQSELIVWNVARITTRVLY